MLDQHGPGCTKNQVSSKIYFRRPLRPELLLLELLDELRAVPLLLRLEEEDRTDPLLLRFDEEDRTAPLLFERVGEDCRAAGWELRLVCVARVEELERRDGWFCTRDRSDERRETAARESAFRFVRTREVDRVVVAPFDAVPR